MIPIRFRKYQMEPYLYLVKNPKYRMAISKFRSSSHILEIKRGRHTRPITPLENRLCPLCKVVETEIHFLLECPMYECYRKELFSKIVSVDSYVKEVLPINKFTYPRADPGFEVRGGANGLANRSEICKKKKKKAGGGGGGGHCKYISNVRLS